MRVSAVLLASALALMAHAASAQTDNKVWTAAPTPGGAGAGVVAPADRAGSGSARTSDAGPDASLPFSSVPSGIAGSQSSPASGDPTPGRNSEVPNLSR